MNAPLAATRPGQSVAFRLGIAMMVILVVVVTGTIVAAGRYGQRAADETFDRLLRGAALQIAERITVNEGATDVDLPVSAFELLSLARSDRVFYRIVRPDGKTLTGYDDLPLPAGGGDGIYDATYKGVPIRAIRLTRRLAERSLSGAVGIIVAQTIEERAALAQSITTQAVMIIAGAGVALLFLAMIVVRFALRPLARVERAMLDRDVRDLSPINVPAPAEVSILVEAINRFMRRLDLRIEGMQNLVADAAHQLRTPITAMRAQAQLALDEHDTQKLERLHRRIYQRSVGLGRLTDQLLSRALIAHRADSEALETLDLRRVAIETEREVRAGLGDPLDLRLPGDEVLVKGDFVSLREAIKNLVNNAVKHGKAPVSLIVTEPRDGRAAALVHDAGDGIPEAAAAQIGRRFSANGISPDSAGLGLSIVAAVVTSHGAKLVMRHGAEGGFEIGLDMAAVDK
jgi:two-component system sensor histidine kinase TctE